MGGTVNTHVRVEVPPINYLGDWRPDREPIKPCEPTKILKLGAPPLQPRNFPGAGLCW